MIKKGLNALRDDVHENAVNKGFWEEVNVSRFVLLIASELFEALEADRVNNYARDVESPFGGSVVHDLETGAKCSGLPRDLFIHHVKSTFEDEMADTFIRLLDLAGGLGVDLEDCNCAVGYEKLGSEFYQKLQNIAFSIITITSDFPEKIFDALYYISCFCEEQNVDLYRHVDLKMWYNGSRERLHGKRY